MVSAPHEGSMNTKPLVVLEEDRRWLTSIIVYVPTTEEKMGHYYTFSLGKDLHWYKFDDSGMHPAESLNDLPIIPESDQPQIFQFQKLPQQMESSLVSPAMMDVEVYPQTTMMINPAEIKEATVVNSI
jgi:hypothetical protein